MTGHRRIRLLSAVLLLSVPGAVIQAETQYEGEVSLGAILENANPGDTGFSFSSGLAESWLQFESEVAQGTFSGRFDLEVNTEKYVVVNDNNTPLNAADDFFEQAEFYEFMASDVVYQQGPWFVGQIDGITNTEAYIEGMDQNLDIQPVFGFSYIESDYGVQLSTGAAYEDDDIDNKYTLTGTGSGEMLADYSLAAYYSGNDVGIEWSVDGQYAGLAKDQFAESALYLGAAGTYKQTDQLTFSGALTSGKNIISQNDEISAAVLVDSFFDKFTVTGSLVLNTSESNEMKVTAIYQPMDISSFVRFQEEGNTLVGVGWLYKDAIYDFKIAMELQQNNISGSSQLLDMSLLYSAAPNMLYSVQYIERHPDGLINASDETKASVEYTKDSGLMFGLYYEKDTALASPIDQEDSFYHGIHLSVTRPF